MSGIVSKNGGRASGIVGAGAIGADAVGNSNIADDSIDSEHYVDGSIDNAHISDDAIDSEHYAAGSIDEAHLAADCVTGAKIADDAIDSEHYTDASIDAAHIASNAVTTAKINADAVTGAKIADDTLNSEHYAAGSVDLEHMSSESVDEDNLHISNAGSNGQFLSKQSGNAGGLTWAAAGGGAWTKIGSTVTASADAAITFTSGISSTYNIYVITLAGTHNSGDSQIHLTFSNDTGSTWEAGSAYEYANQIWEADAGTATNNNTGQAAIQIGLNHTTDASIGNAQNDSHIIYITRPATASQYTSCNWQGIYHSTGNSPTTHFGGGIYEVAEAIDGFKLAVVGGSNTFVVGDFTLYGIAI